MLSAITVSANGFSTTALRVSDFGFNFRYGTENGVINTRIALGL
jgi:hypothetical protein